MPVTIVDTMIVKHSMYQEDVEEDTEEDFNDDATEFDPGYTYETWNITILGTLYSIHYTVYTLHFT